MDAKRELLLPWPDRSLHPNARVHWSVKACSARSARTVAYWTAYAESVKWPPLPDGPIHVWIDGYPPDKRRRDADGLLSSLKSCLDGIADAMDVDDRRFVPHPRVWDEVRKGGEVRIRITTEDRA